MSISPCESDAENSQPQVSIPGVTVIKADRILKSWRYLLVDGVLLMVNGEETQGGDRGGA